LQHGADGFTYPPKEAALRNLLPLKMYCPGGFKSSNLMFNSKDATTRPPRPSPDSVTSLTNLTRSVLTTLTVPSRPQVDFPTRSPVTPLTKLHDKLIVASSLACRSYVTLNNLRLRVLTLRSAPNIRCSLSASEYAQYVTDAISNHTSGHLLQGQSEGTSHGIHLTCALYYVPKHYHSHTLSIAPTGNKGVSAIYNILTVHGPNIRVLTTC
jgi:hypothetical protein